MMNADTKNEFDVSDQIVAFKKKMAPMHDVLKRTYADVRDYVSRAADRIRSDTAAGRPTIPELAFRDIKDGKINDATRRAIRMSGCAVVRGVFPESQANSWFDDVGRYLEDNHYEKKEVEKRSLDKYFSALKAGKPQIFNVCWSKAQVLARQDQKLAETRTFLDRLWVNYKDIFNPDLQCAYADRVRRRQPGDKTLVDPRTWMPAPSNDGSIRATKKSTRGSSPATGAAMTRSTHVIGWRHARSLRPPLQVCSAPTRDGLR